MVLYAAQGDPRRSMALLWRNATAGGAAATEGTAVGGRDGAAAGAGEGAAAGGREGRNSPGPRPALSVDMIVDAAIAVADADGMTGLSMRAVGERLGRTAMALYTYVPNKAELLDLMYDRAHAEVPTDYDPATHWRVGVTAWAAGLWTFYLRHPWVLRVSQARPVLGPNEYLIMETLVRILDGAGLDPRTLRRAVGALFHLIRGAAQTAAEARQAATATGLTDEEWWYARSAMLTEVAPDFAERFPALTRMERAGAFRNDDETVPYLEQEARENFDAGLAILLDGIATTARR